SRLRKAGTAVSERLRRPRGRDPSASAGRFRAQGGGTVRARFHRLLLSTPHRGALRGGRLCLLCPRSAQARPFPAASSTPEFLQVDQGVLRRYYASTLDYWGACGARGALDRWVD